MRVSRVVTGCECGSGESSVGQDVRGANVAGGVGQRTVGLLVLLVLSHGFEAGGTSEDFVGEATLVVGLRAILSVDILMGLRGVV